MTETIPADVDQAATRIADKYLGFEISCQGLYEDIARAIMAHTARQEERIKELEAGLKPFYAASEAHKAAVERYNARLVVIHEERKRGDWSGKMDAYCKAMDDARRDFYGASEDLRKLALLEQK